MWLHFHSHCGHGDTCCNCVAIEVRYRGHWWGCRGCNCIDTDVMETVMCCNCVAIVRGCNCIDAVVMEICFAIVLQLYRGVVVIVLHDRLAGLAHEWWRLGACMTVA